MFNDFKALGDDIIALIDPAQSLIMVAGFKSIVAAWFIFYLIITGYKTMAGISTSPARDIIAKVIMFSLISMFAFNINGWFDKVNSGINNLNTWAINSKSGVSIHDNLESGLTKITKLHEVFRKNDPTYFEVYSDAAAAIVYVAYYVFAAFITIILIINSLVLKLVVFIFPIVVVTLYFSWFKGVFERWIELALSNLLTMLFISLFFNAIWTKFSTKMDSIISTAATVPLFATAFGFAGLSFVAFFLLRLATSLAEKLTRASIDSLPAAAASRTAQGAAITAGAAAMGARAGYRGARAAAIGTSATRKSGKAGGANALARGAASSAHSLVGRAMGKRKSSGSASTGASKGGRSSQSASQKQHARYGSINKYKRAKEGNE